MAFCMAVSITLAKEALMLSQKLIPRHGMADMDMAVMVSDIGMVSGMDMVLDIEVTGTESRQTSLH